MYRAFNRQALCRRRGVVVGETDYSTMSFDALGEKQLPGLDKRVDTFSETDVACEEHHGWLRAGPGRPSINRDRVRHHGGWYRGDQLHRDGTCLLRQKDHVV